MVTARIGRGRDVYWKVRPILSGLELVIAQLPSVAAQRLFVLMRGGTSLFSRAVRFALLRRLTPLCGELVDLREDVYFYGLSGANIGARVSIHPLCYIDATGGLTIGDDTSIAHGSTVMTTSHIFESPSVPIRDQGVKAEPVIIGSGVWIGAGVRILGGVVVGDGSIVAAGAVVTRDVPPNSLVAGVPARIIRARR